MTSVAIYDTKSYDRHYFERAPGADRIRRVYHEFRLTSETAASVQGAQVACAEKSNEITAIPLLLDMVAKGSDRQSAYRLVQGAAKRAWAGDVPFADALRDDPAVGEWLTPDEIGRAMDLRHHLAGIEVTYRALGLETGS